MASNQELQVQQKQEVGKQEEGTFPSRVFAPVTDIYETEGALTVVLEMPGINKNQVEVRVEDGVLHVAGQLNFSKYRDLTPVYTEYNIGHYSRSFRLSQRIDQNKISAELKDGVLALVLPKVEEAKARAIKVK